MRTGEDGDLKYVGIQTYLELRFILISTNVYPAAAAFTVNWEEKVTRQCLCAKESVVNLV